MTINIFQNTSILNTSSSCLVLGQFSNLSSKFQCLQNNTLVAGNTQYLLNIISQPISQTINSGNNLNLSVQVNNVGPITYQWYFNNIPLQNATFSTLTINNVTNQNAGKYYVLINNNFVPTTSNIVTITVLNLPVITNQPKSQTVSVGVNARLSISVTSSLPVSYNWYFNNTLISSATSSELVIENSSKSDNGIYYVIVSNTNGTIKSNSATLFVLYPNPPNTPNPPNKTSNCNDLYSCLYNQLYNQFYNQLYNQLYNQIYNQLYIQLNNALINSEYQQGPSEIIPVPNSNVTIPNSEINENNYNNIYDTLYNSMYDNLYNELYNQLYNPTYDNLFLKFSTLTYSNESSLNIDYLNVNSNSNEFGNIYNNLFNQIIKQLYSQLFTQLFNQLYPQLKEQIYK